MQRLSHTQRGFTLTEVMVAMVIGLLGMLVMIQMFSNSEGLRQSTSGTSDAQNSGAMALYALQRDLRQAGYGFNALTILGCPLALPAPASRTLTELVPVIINPPTTDVPAGDANSDTLLIAYSGGNGTPEGENITLASGSVITIKTPGSFTQNNYVVAAPGTPSTSTACTTRTLAKITSATGAALTLDSASGAVTAGTVFNFGNAPRIVAYAVRNGNLTMCDYMSANCGTTCTTGNLNCNANWIPIADNIVALKAQYRLSTGNWDPTAPLPVATTIQQTFACQWARMSAIRIAVVARSRQIDKAGTTSTAPTWDGSTNSGSGSIADVTNPINLSALSNWQQYRYRTFETVVPLRNLPWMAACS